MTLIAAFKTKDGVAICADSQETVEDKYGNECRQAVQKIAPISISGYQLVVAGSGDSDPIEMFILRAERRFKLEQESPSVDRALFLLEEELDLFYRFDLSPGHEMKLFIAVSCPSVKQYRVWVSHLHLLKEVGDAELIGWDVPFYKVLVKRFYQPGMTIQQAILAALYVLVVGEESSNSIKGPFSLSVVRENGIWEETEEYINTLQIRLKTFESQTNQILLSCADTSIYSQDLHTSLINFATTAREVHEGQINEAIAKMAAKGFLVDDPLCKVPPGILVEKGNDGKYTVRHDVNGIEELGKRINEAFATNDVTS